MGEDISSRNYIDDLPERDHRREGEASYYHHCSIDRLREED